MYILKSNQKLILTEKSCKKNVKVFVLFRDSLFLSFFFHFIILIEILSRDGGLFLNDVNNNIFFINLFFLFVENKLINNTIYSKKEINAL